MTLILWMVSLFDLCETEEDPITYGGGHSDPDG